MDNSAITIETYNKSAKQFQDKFMNMDLYNDSYDRFCELTTAKPADLLEIACGPGNVTRYLLNKRPDFNILGIDLSEAMIELARVNIPSAEFLLMDCRQIATIDREYDGILCGFGLPYLSKEEAVKLIGDAAKLLREGGILYFSTMEGEYSKSGFETTSFSGTDEVFIYYHQADFLTQALCENGFELIDLLRQQYPESDGTFSTDMIFFARKKQVHN